MFTNLSVEIKQENRGHKRSYLDHKNKGPRTPKTYFLKMPPKLNNPRETRKKNQYCIDFILFEKQEEPFKRQMGP